jgi:uncharacterized protein YxeA
MLGSEGVREKEKDMKKHVKKNNNKKNNIRLTAAAAFITLAIIMMVVVSVGAAINNNTAIATTRSTPFINEEGDLSEEPKAPMAASEDGNNVYVVWWTNRSGNWEVMFRASNDGGATFGDKVNLSNSTDADSWNAEIVASGLNVYVSWWEASSMNNGTSESVLRASTDGGETFGPMLMLGTNGTIGDTGEEEGEGEGA